MPAMEEIGGWPAVLGRLVEGRDLDRSESREAMADILTGEVGSARIAGYLVGLRAKGETADEVLGMVDAMLEAATPVAAPGNAIDIVGTGGATPRRTRALNVSTMACFVAAAAGALVCKHGNRKASSTSGSFDFLEALGLQMELDSQGVERLMDREGIAFCFARIFHPAMRHAAPVRSELAIPTVFNLLGPLSHPGGVLRQVIGVADASRAILVADVLRERSTPRAMVVHGHGGLDELSVTGPSEVVEVRDGEIHLHQVDPRSLGLDVVSADQVPGGDPQSNAGLFERMLDGELGPVRDTVLLNAAAGLVVAGMADTIEEGLPVAAAAVDSGAVGELLERLRHIASSANR